MAESGRNNPIQALSGIFLMLYVYFTTANDDYYSHQKATSATKIRHR